jgi:NAD(P)-dependent dehydrogenase (short-subunit alcohol dehydrogenase family)
MAGAHANPDKELDCMTLDGKVALVTGASGGIGRAVCRRLARDGARIVAHYNSRGEAAEALVAELDGGGHSTVGADLRDPAAVEAMVAAAVDRTGRLDVLVNNAGIYAHHPPLEVSYEAWQEHWQRTLETNLLGPAWAAWCAARAMVRQGEGGRIVNVGSRGAFRGEPDAPAYGASKAGLHAMSQSLAVALAPHRIAVFAVAPGFVETAMARPYMTGELGEAIRRQSPLGRVATADDVAYWVACLAAPDAVFATGAIVDVNGASYLRT